MRLKEFRLFSVLFFISFSCWAQFTLDITVVDGSNNPVNNVEVYLKNIEYVLVTDETGKVQYNNLDAAIYDLIVFAYGYKIVEQKVSLSANEKITIPLEQLGEQLSEVVLTQQREKVFALRRLREVEGTAIYSGKKTEVIQIDQITGNLAANNARQVYSQVVGLNIYENNDAGLQLNIGGRGLDPNRSANFNTRQNGYDISADVLGYPESYYTPPPEALSEIQVIRGAASLQYGTQFGGLINFKFKPPSYKPIEFVSRQSIGSNNLLTSYNSLSGTKGKLSYFGYFLYKEGDGFRPNSRFNSRNGHIHIGYQFTDKTKLTAEWSKLNYLAKQAGGLTDAQFIADPEFSNRERNWFDVDWNLYSLRLDHQFSTNTDASLHFFGLDASRSAVGFRQNRVSQPDDITQARELLVDNFSNWGAEARVLTRYKIKERTSALLLGSKFYKTSNDQRQGPGSASLAPDFNFATDQFPNFERQAQFDLPNLNVAFFGENVFKLSDKLTVTPGFRFEYVKTESEGSFQNIVLDLAGNVLLNEAVRDDRVFERNFILLGIGATYKWNKDIELYANFSENYRSVTFSDIRITNPSFIVDPNIGDEDGFTADLGLRGKLGNDLSFDFSAYGLLYDNRLGEVLDVDNGRVVRLRGNIGKAFIYGLETFADWNIKNTLLNQNDNLKLNMFTNLALTQSEYLESQRNNVEGKKVEFIPTINLKTGLNFGYKNLLGSIQYTYLSEQFTDATNAPQDVTDNQRGIEGSIPAYDILDVSLSYTYKKWKLETGINNLLNKSYFTRRATGYPGPGIIPSPPLTFYTTLQFKI
ncbi:TonB-dependent receptor [Spongiivirga sp. MCCC 1A20706]|uniref:TonB-dependent receptor domain-containing protein n=1 Tax=Spongiivirga sp. MCCC 1A20706 TaxID=3160963 RepID=UPI003977963B